MPKQMGYARLMLGVALVVAMMAGCAGSRTQARTGEAVDDGVIGTKVKAALLADDEVSGLPIEVDTYKGTVQLSGFVNASTQSEKAEQIARRVDGVKEVINKLTVK